MNGHDPLIERRARRVAHVPNALLRAKAMQRGDDPGWIEGYAAVYGNLDLTNEVMQRGCFARSIREAVPAGKVKLMAMHYRDGGDALQVIGTVTAAGEDERGLWVPADLSAVQRAQDIRTRILEGTVKSLSVGYRAIRWENRQIDGVAAVVHLESALFEVTVTVKPVNELAVITAAKSLTASSQDSSLQTIRRDIDLKQKRMRILFPEL